MAFYTISFPKGLLNEQQQARIAQVITTVHTEEDLGVNKLGLRVLFMESCSVGYVSGEVSPCVLVRCVYKGARFMQTFQPRASVRLWEGVLAIACENGQTCRLTLSTCYPNGQYTADEENIHAQPPVCCSVM